VVLSSWNILLVEDDEDDYLLTRSLLSEIKGAAHKLHWVSSYKDAVNQLTLKRWDAVLVDYDLGARTGLDLVRVVSSNSDRTPVILLTGRGSYETDVEAMRAGAADYLTKDEVTPLLLERAIRYSIERKHTEEELRNAKELLEERVKERTRELEQAYQNQVESEKHAAMGRMLASIAHELNNPIQTIENCLFLLDEELKPDDNISEVMKMAVSEANRIATLVNQVREMFRPNQTGPMQPVKVLSVLNDVRILIAPHLQHQQVSWIQDPYPNPPTIIAISGQIKQVFLNISLNAIDAMQPDGGELCVEVNEIPAAGQICISFRDTGPGISEENLAKIFEPFFTTKDKGTGLGLAICYDIVKRHGGYLTVDSRLGEGAQFNVFLPLESA
jgi:signal transduction histidine kinase